jgi:hypothetical protein
MTTLSAVLCHTVIGSQLVLSCSLCCIGTFFMEVGGGGAESWVASC